MNQKKNKQKIGDNVMAPGIDEADDAYGRKATNADMESGEFTKVTRFVFDEYDPSKE